MGGEGVCMLGESPGIYSIHSAAVTPITNRRASPLITLKNDISTHTHTHILYEVAPQETSR